MKKNVYYRYNPETDNFERVYPTLWGRLKRLIFFGGVSLAFGGVFFLIGFYGCGTPRERDLRTENNTLKQQYQVMNRRLENALRVMKDIENRDDNFYRVLMQMDPVAESRRYAGLDNEQRYRDLRKISDGELVRLLARRLDLFERQLYAQSRSFDEIKKQVENSDDRLSHIPSILPISDGMDKLSAGFGLRRDPVTGDRIFHSGHDFIVREGIPVIATASGTVKIAGREGGHGNNVVIDHGYNYETRYSHLSEIVVKEGVVVKRGDMIGRVGSTGSSRLPHLHYEVFFRDKAQDPVNYYFNELSPEEFSLMARQAENAGQVLD